MYVHNSIPSISFAIFSGFFQYKYCGLVFCFATPLSTQCSATILRLNFARLQLHFRILSQNCNWIFSLISSPAASVNKVNPLFSSLSFLRVLCSIKRYRMKSNTSLLIWSVVTPENNTSIRQLRWATLLITKSWRQESCSNQIQFDSLFTL